MPGVETWIRDAIDGDLPDTYPEKKSAIQFLSETDSMERKRSCAITLLREVAQQAECLGAWEDLVEKKLKLVEEAFKSLLPRHRDHVIHSANLYLLGLAIYLKMLRPMPGLAAVLAETQYRDAQAFFGPSDAPYSCHDRIIKVDDSLAQTNARFPGKKFGMTRDQIDSLRQACYTCSHAHDALECANDAASRADCVCDTLMHSLHAIHALCNESDKRGAVGITHHDKQLPITAFQLDVLFRRKWGQIAVLHDAAYPLEMAAQLIRGYLNETFTSIGCEMSQCAEPFGLTFNRLCDLITLPRVQVVCDYPLNPGMFSDNAFQLIAKNITHKLHVAHSAESMARMMMECVQAGLNAGRLDHGTYSALLMLRFMNDALRTKLGEKVFSPNLEYDNPNRAITENHPASAVEFFYLECVDAASSVYLHNAKRRVPLFSRRLLDYREHPYAWLLFLCDQLQEWLRPSGSTSLSEKDLLSEANRHIIDLDMAGPCMFFSYPDGTEEINNVLRGHLRLFGQDFVMGALPAPASGAPVGS
jgi:hypothetical protein